MGKVQDKAQAQQDKIKQKDLFDEMQVSNAVQKRNQGDPANPTDQLVGENNVGFNQQGNIGTTKFDNKIVPGIDFFNMEDSNEAETLLGDVIAETRAQEQSTGEKVLHGVGRVLAKVGTETGKGLGYIGGAVPALIMQDMDLMTNNFLVEAFQGMEDASKEALPVYVRDEVENGSFARQIWSPEFWATEGADGLGFLLSAVLTGGATQAVAKGLKIGTGVAKMLGKGASVANKVETGLITTTQTFLESAAETKGIRDSLKAEWESHKQPDGTYIGEDGITRTQEEVDALIGEASIGTLGLNMLLLAGPNALQTKYLFGQGDDMVDMLKGIPKGSAKEMSEGLAKLKPWKGGVTEGLKSVGAESFQELSQFAIEHYEDKKGKGLSNQNWVEGLVEGYIEGLTTIEGQKSMFLGGILGIGPGAVGGYKSVKAQKKQAGSLIDLMSKSSQKFKDDITQVYEKDDKGNVKIDPKTKKPIIDSKKFFELIDSESQSQMSAKLYQEAKLNKDISSARFALSEMTIRNIFPYLQTAGGLELWKEHSKQVGAVVENDATDLGFENVEEYHKFLDETAETAKAEYKKIKNYGPSFFGLNPGKLMEHYPDKAAANAVLQNFIGNVEYNAVRLSSIQDGFKAELAEAEKEVKALEQALPRDENGNVTARDMMLEPFIKNLNKKIEVLKNIMNKNGEQYTKLFDKKEQQAALDALVAQDVKMTEAKEEDAEAEQTTRTFEAQFKENLKEKGYTLEKNEDGTESDFATKQVILKDDEGNVYRVDNQWNKKTKTKEYFLKNLTTGESVPFSVENLRKLGLDKPENIITRDDYAKYKQAERVITTNKRKLAALGRLLKVHTKSHATLKYDKKLLLEKYEQYAQELAFWKENENYSGEDVLLEILRLEDLLTETSSQIENLEEQKKELEQSLRAIRQLKTEIIKHIQAETGLDFNFDAKLTELKNKLINEDYELDEKVLDESIRTVEDWLAPLYRIKSTLEDTITALVDKFADIEYIESLFEMKLTNKELAQKIKVNLPSIEINGETVSNLSKTQLKNLLKDPEISARLLKEVRAQKGEMLSDYRTAKLKLAEIGKLRNELNKLQNNKKLLIQYNRTKLEIKNLLSRNNIARSKLRAKTEQKNLSKNQDKRSPSSPVEQVAKEDVQNLSAKKHTPWSTISALFDISKRDENGDFPLSKNWKQAARWAKVMGNIAIKNLDQYSVRFVNNAQLEEITGQNAPVNTVDALYAVLYKGQDVFADEGGVIYTGIAHSGTYFKKDFSSIDVMRLPQYKPYKNIEITKENPAVYDGEEYTSSVELEKAILQDVAKEYSEWRKDIVDKLDSTKEEIYSGISDISKGISRRSEVNHKPKEVLDIESLDIPDKTILNKTNGAEVDVEPGMVYARLKNGQIEKLKNKTIGESADSDAYVNKILHFIRLFEHMKDDNFKSTFAFKGKGNKPTKSRVPLVSNSGKTGILNYFLNWGYYDDATYSISVHPIEVDGEKTGGLELAITHEGVKINIPLSDLKNDKGETRKSGDPKILELTDFLKTKFKNVNKKDLNNTKLDSFWLPTGWSQATPTSPPLLTYKKYDSYNDYVLDNNLYSDVAKYDESTDEIPTFVNQYITFDEETTPTLPEVEVEEEIEEEEKTPTPAPKKQKGSKAELDVEEIVEYADDVFTVAFKGEDIIITNAQTDEVITNDSKLGKSVMKKVDMTAVNEYSEETTETAPVPPKSNEPPLSGYEDDGPPVGNTFQTVLSKKPVKDVPKNEDPKDDTTDCLPSGPKKKTQKKRIARK